MMNRFRAGTAAAAQDLTRRADWLAGHLAELPALTAPGQNDAALAALAELMRRLPTGPAFIVADGDLVKLRMLGLTAISHTGLAGACRAWIASARYHANRGSR